VCIRDTNTLHEHLEVHVAIILLIDQQLVYLLKKEFTSMRKYMQRLNLVYLLKKEFTSMWKFMQRLNLFELCLILVAQFILYVGVVVIVSKEKAKNKQPNKIDEECCRPYPAGKMNNLTHQHMHANASKSTPPNYPSIHMQIKRVIHQSDCHPCMNRNACMHAPQPCMALASSSDISAGPEF
jgi:hypothetical protein